MKRGKFISFESGEGAGKTTQVNLLANWLQSLGRRVEITREPGDSPYFNCENRKNLLIQGKQIKVE